MGFNTTIVILNDHLSTIGRDTQFGAKVQAAIQEAALGCPVEVSGYGNSAVVVDSTHSGDKSVIVVGGNLGRVLNPYANERHRYPNEQAILLLETLAVLYGYKLVKKGADARATNKAVKAEREACAKIADDAHNDEEYGHAAFRCVQIAQAIRARPSSHESEEQK
jgi:hypothetical protein